MLPYDPPTLCIGILSNSFAFARILALLRVFAIHRILRTLSICMKPNRLRTGAFTFEIYEWNIFVLIPSQPNNKQAMKIMLMQIWHSNCGGRNILLWPMSDWNIPAAAANIPECQSHYTFYIVHSMFSFFFRIHAWDPTECGTVWWQISMCSGRWCILCLSSRPNRTHFT